MDKRRLLAVLIATGSMSCAQPKLNNGVNWGHLRYSKEFWFSQLPPGSSVGVCGDHADDVVSGIKQWAAGAGRDARLTVTASCSAQVTRSVTVLGTTRSEAQTSCRAMGPNVAGFTAVEHGTVVLCNEAGAASTLLHEAGHLWGMCDLYQPFNTASDNCDNNYFSGRSSDIVMGSDGGLALAPGDATGIQKMIARADVAGNAAWHSAAASPATTASLDTQSPATHLTITHAPADINVDQLAAILAQGVKKLRAAP